MRFPGRPALMILLVIPVFWILEAAADAYLFKTSSFGAAFWPAEPHHLLLRLAPVAALLCWAVLLRPGPPSRDPAGAGAPDTRARPAPDLLLRNRLAEAFLLKEGRQVFDEALAVFTAALDSPAGLLARRDQAGDLQVMSLQTGPGLAGKGPRIPARDVPVALQETMSGGRPRIVLDPAGIPVGELAFASLLAVPLAGRDQVLGLIAVADRRTPYTEGDRVLIASLAEYLAPILLSWTVAEQREMHILRAQKMEALGALAGGIAHDFNNILQAILGFAAMARDEARTGSRTAGDLDRVLRAAERGRDLVQRILLASRTEDQERQSVRLQDLVAETCDLLRSAMPAAISLKPILDPQCGPVFADPAQLRQALLNLATNSIHAMEPRGGVLTIALGQAGGARDLPGLPAGLAGRDVAVLKVSDTGCGMDEATLGRLFDPFFTTKAVGRGTGLGLSVVHGIITAHQGGVFVESKRGTGTTVTLYLPAGLPPDRAGTADAAAAAPRDRRGRIMFVDDQQEITLIGQSYLQNQGFRVYPFNDPEAALQDLAADPKAYDLVVTDHAMPHLTGLQFADRIRNIRPDLPVILITGYAERLADWTADHPSIKDVLQKPFGSQVLEQAITAALAGKAAARGGGAHSG